MTNKEIEARLKRAVSETTPDVLEKVMSADVVKDERMANIMPMNSNKKKLAGKIIAACAAIAIVFSGAAFFAGNARPESKITIDVNPSVEIITGKTDRVKDVKPLNDDGETIIDGMDFKDTDIDVVVNALIGSMAQKGYLTEVKNENVLVSVQNDDAEKAEKIRQQVVGNVRKALSDNNVSATVFNQVVTDDKSAEDLVKQYGISYGKAVFISQLLTIAPDLDAKALSEMTISEIAALVESKNIDISKIIRYEYDDSIHENIEDAIEDWNEQDNALVSQEDYIGREAALYSALKHAGVASDKATGISVKLDVDEDGVEYDVEFHANGKEYEYEINALTGQIKHFESEIDNDYDDRDDQDDKDDDDDDTVTTKPTSSSTQPSTGAAVIGVEKAKAAAFKHAGVSASGVKVLSAELERDDGVTKYDIDFVSGKWEYDYDINAYTGAVISMSKELYDDKQDYKNDIDDRYDDDKDDDRYDD